MSVHGGILKRREKELLEKAKEVFSERGFHKASVSDIVNSMGIARGTFYIYFRNKDHIYRKVLEQLVSEISSCLKVIDSERYPLVQLRQNLKDVFDLIMKDKELAKIVIYHPYKVNNSFDQILENFFESVKGLIRKALIRGIKLNFIRDCDVEIVSSLILGSFIQIVKDIVKGNLKEKDIDKVVDEMLFLTLKGLVR